MATGTSWGSYPSIYNLGHAAIADLFKGPVIVEEKIDGSQFSFGCFEQDIPTEVGSPVLYPERTLRIRSKGADIIPNAPPKMFAEAIATVQTLFDRGALTLGWTYRGEVLQKLKHNALTYNRVPERNIILFDINTGDEQYLSYADKRQEAERLGLECVPLFYEGRITSADELQVFLERESVLGGPRIEGVVIKPRDYDLFGRDKKVLMGKFVSEAFREVHKRSWGESNPTRTDVVEKLIADLATPARYQKAVQHLKERGVIIEDTVKNIGAIIAEVRADIAKEEADYIAKRLYQHFADQILRQAASGVPTWYKDVLLHQQFEQEIQNTPL